MVTNKYFVCPYCNKKFTRDNLVIHLRNKHADELPEGFSPLRTAFHIVNGRDFNYARRCRVCKQPTNWDENKGRYDFLCGTKSCHDKYVEIMRENMGEKCGVNRQTQTAEGLKKMLAGRKISGKYKLQDGTEVDYTGSYEKKALEFFDNVLNIKASDLMIPGPVLSYELDGVKHFYIPDILYIPYNLIIEVKDGGDRPNKNPNWTETRKKQIAKEEYIIKQTDFNYLRLTNNDFSQLLSVFADLKMSLKEYGGERVIHVNESFLNEKYLINKDDIYYNKNKFDSGEINLCFITGHSGSGKSTMGRNMSKDNIEHYELDDLNTNYKFSDDELKEYGDLIYSFFKGPGKKYRYETYEDMQNCTNPLDDSGDEYDKFINIDFINYAIKYAKSHKNTKFVIEGVWIFFFIEPKELKDFAVYIKGTSALISSFRASKRDSSDEENKAKRFLYTIKGTVSGFIKKYDKKAEKLINNYRNYYSKLENGITENMVSTIHGTIPSIGDNDLVVVQYLQNNVFANSTKLAIADNPKFDTVFIKDDFDHCIKKVDKSFLENCKYSTYILKEKKDEILAKCEELINSEVDDEFFPEIILGHGLFTDDQLQFESSIIPYEDFYYNSQKIEENCINYILGKDEVN